MHDLDKEMIQAALALILGPETDDQARTRAVHRLMTYKGSILSLFLATLSSYPEITTPEWPWWPVQYAHTSRLLLHLCYQSGCQLEDVLTHDSLPSSTSPVVWISLMEAAGLEPLVDHEALLCQGLQTSWSSVRYAAAIALANRANHTHLHPQTLEQLHTIQRDENIHYVQLVVAHALLLAGDTNSLDIILKLTANSMPAAIRKAATFLLSTNLPHPLTNRERDYVIIYLLQLLTDKDNEIAQQAAHALAHISRPATLPHLYRLLNSPDIPLKILVLTILEELCAKKSMRHLLRQQALPTHLLSMITTPYPDLRRQTCYTMAACGGEYVTAVLGTIIANPHHPGYLEALESLRVLFGAYRAPLRDHIIRWLLRALHQTHNEEQLLSTLDVLIYLLWHTQTNRKITAWKAIKQAIVQDGKVLQCLYEENSKIRQKAIEVFIVLGNYLTLNRDLHPTLINMLRTDPENDIRACIAHMLGQTNARWSIPDLLQALLDPNDYVAHTALTALGHIANFNDTIVVYVLTELANIKTSEDQSLNNLAHSARHLIKKWQRAKHHIAQK